MVKNVYECLMCLQCLLCRGPWRGRGRWLFWVTEVGTPALSRLAKLFLTLSVPPARHSAYSLWVHLGIFVVLLFRLMTEIISEAIFFLHTQTHMCTHTLSCFIVFPSFSFSLWFFPFLIDLTGFFLVFWVGLALVEYEKYRFQHWSLLPKLP